MTGPSRIVVLALAGAAVCSCGGSGAEGREERYTKARDQMVESQIAARGVRDERVLRAMRDVPRHLFVPPEQRANAYADDALAIGEGQTISQPYIVGLMTELLQVGPGSRVLEIGTGSGYQAAVLADMGCDVFTIEIRPALAEEARARLDSLGYENVHVRVGDGWAGWPEEAPFDGIIVTAASERLPDLLLDQLRVGGHLVIPLGAFYQHLKVIERTEDGFVEREVIPVRFVPMTGEAERQP